MTKKEMCEVIDRVEADLVRLQSALWRVRRELQKDVGLKVGYQYDEPRQPAALSAEHHTS